MTRLIVWIFIASAAFLSFLVFRVAKNNSAPSVEVQTAMTEIALKSIKVQYETMETGIIPQSPFVARHDGETHRYRSGEERIELALRLRQDARTLGKTYKLYQMEFHGSAIKRDKNTIILHGLESCAYSLIDSTNPDPPVLTKEWITHDFIFAIVPANDDCKSDLYSVQAGDECFRLIEDVTEPQMFDESDETTHCCDPDEREYESRIKALPLKREPD